MTRSAASSTVPCAMRPMAALFAISPTISQLTTLALPSIQLFLTAAILIPTVLPVFPEQVMRVKLLMSANLATLALCPIPMDLPASHKPAPSTTANSLHILMFPNTATSRSVLLASRTTSSIPTVNALLTVLPWIQFPAMASTTAFIALLLIIALTAFPAGM